MINLFKKSSQLDFVGVGDIVVDTFIELIDAWIETDNTEKKNELCMSFGDKIPYKKEVSVYGTGNSINAAHAAQKLGLKTGVVTNIGDDDIGKECLKHLEEAGIDTEHVSVNEKNSTNHNFILRFKEERTILIHHNEYKYKFPADFVAPKWIYLSSLAKNSISYHEQIINFLKAHPETKLAFQPGTFQIKMGYEKLRALYQSTEVFFCNKEEAQKIAGTDESDILKLLEIIRGLGPKIVVITDGPLGAYVYDGEKKIHGPMYPDIAPPVDRTGAGDSFSSTFVAALALGHDLNTALQWGPINSMSVVQYIGAQEGHLTQSQITQYLSTAPADYKPKILG